MGHRKKSFSNRGSLGIRPRVRAKRFTARWRTFGAPWVDKLDTPVLTGNAFDVTTNPKLTVNNNAGNSASSLMT